MGRTEKKSLLRRAVSAGRRGWRLFLSSPDADYPRKETTEDLGKRGRDF